jgi:hypothetical protein
MNTERLKLFRTEEEVRSFAKVNGYDQGGADKMVAQWKSATQNPVKEIKKGTKKFGVLGSNDYSSKN